MILKKSFQQILVLTIISATLIQCSQVTPINIDGVMKHLAAFQKAAEDNNNSRSVANGYADSAQYVINTLLESGQYAVSSQPFSVPVWDQLEDPEFEVILADNTTLDFQRCDFRTGWQRYQTGCDYASVRYGGNATNFEITHEIQFVGDGCSSFEMTAGNGALIEIGTCDYYTKVLNAEDAGASFVILTMPQGSSGFPGSRVFNSIYWEEGNRVSQIPSIGVTRTVSQILQEYTDAKVHLKASNEIKIINTYNVIADHIGFEDEDDDSKVVMVGAHLDSVPDGPGINDNGSGSAMILEMALQFASLYESQEQKQFLASRRNRVRFGWWGAEEIGLIGSKYYVDELIKNPTEFEKIIAYFNYDMEAGPNYFRYVYDAETAPDQAKQGSRVLEALLQKHFVEQNLTTGLTGMIGGSDQTPFILAGIPASGMATGAGGIKSIESRQEHGGIANTPDDPCYHANCDTLENVNVQCLIEMGTAAITVLEQLVLTNNESELLTSNLYDVDDRIQMYQDLMKSEEIKKAFEYTCDMNEEIDKDDQQVLVIKQ